VVVVGCVVQSPPEQDPFCGSAGLQLALPIVVTINFECLPLRFRAQIGLSACERVCVCVCVCVCVVSGPFEFRLLVFCISRNGHYELIVPAETSQQFIALIPWQQQKVRATNNIVCVERTIQIPKCGTF